MPDWMVEEMQEDCEWRPTNPDFDEWLKDEHRFSSTTLALPHQ